MPKNITNPAKYGGSPAYKIKGKKVTKGKKKK
jgi:hypothetical protein